MAPRVLGILNNKQLFISPADANKGSEGGGVGEKIEKKKDHRLHNTIVIRRPYFHPCCYHYDAEVVSSQQDENLFTPSDIHVPHYYAVSYAHYVASLS